MIAILKRIMFGNKKKHYVNGVFNPAIKQDVYFTMFDNGNVYVDREMTMKDFSEKLYKLERGLVNNKQNYGEA